MDIEVVPDKWVLPNRIGYNKEVYETFHPSKYPLKAKKSPCKCSEESCELDANIVSLFPQQRIVKDYMQFDSPYRGILLYHELGSGKSAASIAAAEGYVNRKKIVIMTPASLSQNYENELMKISTVGLNLKKAWTLIQVNKKDPKMMAELEKYAISAAFVKKEGLVWIPLYQGDISDAVIVMEKTKYSSLKSEDRSMVDATIGHIIRNRYTFMNYNGLTEKLIKSLGKSPFDDCFVIIDEIHNFISRIVNGSRLARSVYNHLMTAKNMKIVLLSGTPIINNPYEVATLINLIRGPMEVYELPLLKNAAEPDMNKAVEALKKANLYAYIDELSYADKSIHLVLLPIHYKRIADDSTAIHKDEWKIAQASKVIDDIINVLNKNGFKVSVRPKSNIHYALPSIKEDFYKLFIDDTDIEDIKVKNMDLFQRRVLGTLSYYKTTGTEFFPQMLPTTVRYLDMTNHQLNKYIQVRLKEMSMDDAKKKFGNKGKNAFDDKSSVYRAFSRMVCNFAFPEEITRVFPQDVRNYMKKEIGKQSDSSKSSSSSSDGAHAADAAKEINKRAVAEYELQLANAMDELVQSDALDKKNLRTLYSPKFAQMLEDVETSPGSVLIYSQFRSIEGLGIFSEVLKKHGYVEIKIVKHEGVGYVIEDMEVFDKKYDNKRFVVFNADRTKTNILMNIFNGDYSLLPDTILEQLPDNKDQLYGKLVKIMMITQSGAEGISLKNVRRVLITEYFWNAVRINQVIGRAVRTCSHQLLPKQDQNVGVFLYIMKLTRDQLNKNPTLRKKDNDLTTDQHILEIANKKEYIVNMFLNMLKASSMDCITHSVQNKPLQNGYKCYNWPINVNNNELTYTPDIKDDGKIQRHQKLQVKRKNKGVVVSKNGKKYVMMNNKLYDYFSYVNAGLLLPVAIAK
jgi:superfamily II DNA or RNA helicase